MIQKVVRVLILHQVLLALQVLVLHRVLLQEVLFVHILDTKGGQEVANAVRQVNQSQEVHQDKVEEAIHQDHPDVEMETIDNKAKIKIQYDGTKGLNKLKLYARH
jgi:hypothetical protein